jgi:hypothetical protein
VKPFASTQEVTFFQLSDPRLLTMSSSKMSRTDAPETFGDVALTSPEISHASGLLLRASKHGRLYLIEETLKNAPHVKQFLVSTRNTLAAAATAAGKGYCAFRTD